MVRMRYGSALGRFGEHRRSPNAPKCIGMHLGAFVPNALPERIRTINMVCMRYGSALGTLGAFREHLCSSNVPNALP